MSSFAVVFTEMIKLFAFFVVAVVTVAGSSHENNWEVKDDKTGHVCLLMKGTFQIDIQYKNKSGEIVKHNITVPQVNQTEVEGNCAQKINAIKVPFFVSGNLSWSLRMMFSRINNTYSLTAVGVSYYLDEHRFPDAKSEDMGKEVMEGRINMTMWTTAINSSYLCNSREQITNFTNIHGSLPDVQLLALGIANEQMEAFRETNTTKFSDAVSCEADVDKISNIVPIVVGAALAGFVVIVLIAYLIGRRRSKRGYESV